MKERLVGAAVLVAIGAWLIPWVLDGPERIEESATTPIELPAPPVDAPPVRTETVVLDRRESPTPTTPETPPSSTTHVQAASPAPTAPPVAAVESQALEPEPRPPEAGTEQSAPAAETQWYVQLGAFGDIGNADRLAARVATYGYDGKVLATPSGGDTVHRVRVGPEPTRARAEAIASALSAHGFVAQVVFE